MFLQCFKFEKAMYIICNKIRVICSKIRVGMEGGPFSIGGSIFKGVHLQSHRGSGSVCVCVGGGQYYVHSAILVGDKIIEWPGRPRC